MCISYYNEYECGHTVLTGQNYPCRHFLNGHIHRCISRQKRSSNEDTKSHSACPKCHLRFPFPLSLRLASQKVSLSRNGLPIKSRLLNADATARRKLVFDRESQYEGQTDLLWDWVVKMHRVRNLLVYQHRHRARVRLRVPLRTNKKTHEAWLRKHWEMFEPLMARRTQAKVYEAVRRGYHRGTIDTYRA